MRYVGELGEEIWINMPVSHPEAPSDIERAAIVRAAHRFLQNIQDFLDPSRAHEQRFCSARPPTWCPTWWNFHNTGDAALLFFVFSTHLHKHGMNHE